MLIINTHVMYSYVYRVNVLRRFKRRDGRTGWIIVTQYRDYPNHTSPP